MSGEAFTNSLTDYDSFTPSVGSPTRTRCSPSSSGSTTSCPKYLFENGAWAPEDFTATIATREPGTDWKDQALKVNSPLAVGGTNVYLLGNGFAPVVTVKDPSGTVVYQGAVPFISQDSNLTSSGVIKVPDGLKKQVAFQGFFCPTPVTSTTKTSTGTTVSSCQSVSPYLTDPSKALLQLSVFTGDLGLDNGQATNVYALNEDKLTKVAGFGTDVAGSPAHEGQGRDSSRTGSDRSSSPASTVS